MHDFRHSPACRPQTAAFPAKSTPVSAPNGTRYRYADRGNRVTISQAHTASAATWADIGGLSSMIPAAWRARVHARTV
jgi:hypothetical protein